MIRTVAVVKAEIKIMALTNNRTDPFFKKNVDNTNKGYTKQSVLFNSEQIQNIRVIKLSRKPEKDYDK